MVGIGAYFIAVVSRIVCFAVAVFIDSGAGSAANWQADEVVIAVRRNTGSSNDVRTCSSTVVVVDFFLVVMRERADWGRGSIRRKLR